MRELLEPDYGENQPKFGDGDIVEILKEMKSNGWDITTLPQYVTYEHYMWKEYHRLIYDGLTYPDTLEYAVRWLGYYTAPTTSILEYPCDGMSGEIPGHKKRGTG